MPHKQDARSQLPPEDRASSARHSLHTMPPARSRPARLEYQNVTIKSAAAGSFHQPHEALSMALQQLRDCSPQCGPDANSPTELTCRQRQADSLYVWPRVFSKAVGKRQER